MPGSSFHGPLKIIKADNTRVTVIDADGNIDAPVTTTDLTTTGNTTLGDATTDTLTISGNATHTGTAAGNTIDVVSAAKTSGKVLDASDLDAFTTGVGIHLDATGVTQTSGKLVHLDSASTALTSAGRLLLSDHTAAATASGAGILNEFKTAAADATTLVKLTSAAAQTGPVLDISAVLLATGKGIDMSDLDAITTGKAIHVDATGVTHTDGILVHLDSAGTAISSTGRILLSDHTGATTTSGILNELKSIATDETVIAQVTAGGLLAGGKALNVSAATMTTGKGLSMDNLDGLTTGGAISVTSNSADTGTRSLVFVKNDHASATAATCLELTNDAPLGAIKTTVAATSTNFFKVGVFNGVTLWVGNGNTGNAALTGTAGDILFNGGSNKPEYCTGTTNWTALV